jgi:hypothetical protein
MTTTLVAELASRVRSMEGKIPGVPAALPVISSLRILLPQGLQTGSCHAVNGSLSVATALLAEVSTTGEWCGVVGIPEFGAEAAAALGVDLTRTLLVPDPELEWLTVVATLVEVLPIVLVRPPVQLSASDTARLESRVRRRGCVLVVLLEGAHRWPRAAVTIEAGPSEWAGIEAGRGCLSERQIPVRVTDRKGRVRQVCLLQRQGAYVSALPRPRIRAVS